MPILWRYLLRNTFYVLFFCVVAFIAVLLVTRFQEIAQFASSGASPFKILFFTFIQIPFILPMALPFAGLIAAILLCKRLSHTHELTALRAAGLGIQQIIFPLLIAATLLGMVNFTLVSEICPRCKRLSKLMIYEMTAVNPLLLLQKDTMVKFKNAYIDMKLLRAGRYAKDVIVVMRGGSHERLGLMVAKELALNEELLQGKQVTFVSSIDPKINTFDHLVIENQTSMCTKASNLSQLVEESDWTHLDYLSFSELPFSKKTGRVEAARRLSLGLAAFTFTLVGIAFGIEIGRNRSHRGIFWALILSTFFLVTFLAAKSIRQSPNLATLISLLPHPFIAYFSWRAIQRITRGAE